MFLFPVGHDEDELRRWPWVSMVIGAICLAVFLVTSMTEGQAEEQALSKAREAIDYQVRRPYLELDEDLLFGETAALLAEARADVGWASVASRPDEAEVRREQEALEQLTLAWRETRDETPFRSLGLVPAERTWWTFLTHVFVHGGWLHLVGNLFFFWLVGPPLEDVWGRPLYAVVFFSTAVVTGILWVSRYPNSEVAVIGASGAVAGLMGAFMIRFWKTRIRFVYAIWLSLRIYPGSFTAPAWIMLGLWAVRELAFGSYFEPHASPSGGVATWAHLYGFGCGVVAAAVIRLAGVEKRWVRPRILRATGELENRAVEEASELIGRGRLDAAWQRLRDEVESRPANWDAIVSWWDLAGRADRQGEVAPHLMRRIRHDLRSGEPELAWQYWNELVAGAPEVPIPGELRLEMAEGLLEMGGHRGDAVELLARARAEMTGSPPVGTLIRLARTVASAELPGAASLCQRAAEHPDAPSVVREELLRIADRSRRDARI